MKCPVCGETEHHSKYPYVVCSGKYHDETVDYTQCRVCGVMFGSPNKGKEKRLKDNLRKKAHELRTEESI